VNIFKMGAAALAMATAFGDTLVAKLNARKH
jgi:hypothetical protein